MKEESIMGLKIRLQIFWTTFQSATYNAAVCEDLIDAIQYCQEARLDPELVSKGELSEFKLRDIMMGAERYLSSFSKYQTHKVDRETQTPEVVMQVPGVGLVFGSLWTDNLLIVVNIC